MTGGAEPITRQRICEDLAGLGIAPGDVVMVHASLRALGPTVGGPATVVAALCDALGSDGTLLAYVSWDRSPYDETLGDGRLTPEERAAWPAFISASAGAYRGFGLLNDYILMHPDVRRSAHPDASMAAIGHDAAWFVSDHPFGNPYGPGSPLEKFLQRRGRVLLLGAPLDAVTVLHFAEAVADIPGKRRVSYEMPVVNENGEKVWVRTEEFDSNGILDCYARDGEPDAVELITRAYVTEGRHGSGPVGAAQCYLFDAPDLVDFGIRWLETRHGSRRPAGDH